MGIPYKSFQGQYLGMDAVGALVSKIGGSIRRLTSPAVHAVVTISAEAASTANTRDITIQLKDVYGNNINYAETIQLTNYLASTMLDWASTGGSTGIQAGASGKLLALVAKKQFLARTTATGLWVGSYLDTGTEAGYLGVTLPNGRTIGGGALTNA